MGLGCRGCAYIGVSTNKGFRKHQFMQTLSVAREFLKWTSICWKSSCKCLPMLYVFHLRTHMPAFRVILGLNWDYIGIMENKMEDTI